MTTDLATKSICVCDNGLFVAWAEKLAQKFGKVFYFTPWQSAFPRSNDLLIGKGLKGVTRINDFWAHVDECDAFFFPDVYFADIQSHLVKLGKAVWGSGYGEDLELDRWSTKKLLRKIGLPVGNAELITGIHDLREFLKENDRQWVKLSLTRGDFETFLSETYDLSEPKLDELESRLGARKTITEFIVEESLDDRIEIGYDGFTIDGQWPSLCMTAFEIKDAGAIGRVRKYEDIAEPIRLVNDKLTPIFKADGYRNFFSSELRIGKDLKPYLIDPCTRAASPPSELYSELYDNWPEIIWAGAHGELLDPEPVAEFGVEIMIHSSWADRNWQAISFPEKLRPLVKLRNHTIIDGKDYVVPQDVGLPEIGAVLGIGDTLDAAIAMARENCCLVQGYFVECKTDSIETALDQIEEAKQIGIEM